MNVESIKNYMERNRQNMISDLAGLIQIPSISEDRRQLDSALDYVLHLAEEMGFSAEKAADGQIGIVSMGQGNETLGILTHVDVVPPGDLNRWESEPFCLTEKNDRLYGRGTLDDKGAIIAALYAMKLIKDSGSHLYKKVQLIMGTQEEVQWTDMENYTRNYPLPDYGFTPDGEFPICNVEKGSIDICLKFPIADRMKECSGWYLTALHAGTASNAVPGSCTAILSFYENGEKISEKVIAADGKSAHSCQPEKGENAVFRMAEQIKCLDICENRLSRLLYRTEELFQDLYGKKLGLYSESEYYNGEFVHRNTFSPTLVDTVGDHLHITVNVRFGYGTCEKEIIDKLRETAEILGGCLVSASVLPAVYVPKDSPFIKVLAEAYEEGCGRKNQFSLEYGGTYAKAMKNIVSWGPVFPGEEDTCHQENEFIKTESLLNNAAIFALAVQKIVLSEESYK